MSDLYNEHHENIDEYFKMNEPVKGRKKYSTKFASPAIFAAAPIAAAIAAAIVFLSVLHIYCTPVKIASTEAVIRTAVYNADDESDVRYVLLPADEFEEDIEILLAAEDGMRGILGPGRQELAFDELKAGTEYILYVYSVNENGEIDLISDFGFTTVPESPADISDAPSGHFPASEKENEPVQKPDASPEDEPENTHDSELENEPQEELSNETDTPRQETQSESGTQGGQAEQRDNPSPNPQHEDQPQQPDEPDQPEEPEEPEEPEPVYKPEGSSTELHSAQRTEDGASFEIESVFRMYNNEPVRAEIIGAGTTKEIPSENLHVSDDGALTIHSEYTFPEDAASGDVQINVYYTTPTGEEGVISSEPVHIEIGGIDETNTASDLTFTLSDAAEDDSNYKYSGTIAGIRHGTGKFVVDDLRITIESDGIDPVTVAPDESTFSADSDTVSFSGSYTFPKSGTYTMTAEAEGHWELGSSSFDKETGSVTTEMDVTVKLPNGGTTEISNVYNSGDDAVFALESVFEMVGKTPDSAEITGPNGTVSASVTDSGTASGKYTFPAGTTSGDISINVTYTNNAGESAVVSSEPVHVEIGGIDETNTASTLTFTPSSASEDGSAYDYSGTIAGIRHGTGKFVIDDVRITIESDGTEPVTITPDESTSSADSDTVSFSGSYTFPKSGTYEITAEAEGHWDSGVGSLKNETGSVLAETVVTIELPTGGAVEISDVQSTDNGTEFALSTEFLMKGNTPLYAEITGPADPVRIDSTALNSSGGTLTVNGTYIFPENTDTGDVNISVYYTDHEDNTVSVSSEPLHIEIGGIDATNSANSLTFTASGTTGSTYNYSGTIAGIRHGTGSFVIDSLTLTVGNDTTPLTVTQTDSNRISFSGSYAFKESGTYEATATATGHWKIAGSSLPAESGSVSTSVPVLITLPTGDDIEIRSANSTDNGTTFILNTAFNMHGFTPTRAEITGPNGTTTVSVDTNGAVNGEYTFTTGTDSGNVTVNVYYTSPSGTESVVSSDQLHIEIGGIDSANSANSLTFTNSGSANTYNYNGTIAGIHHGTGRFVIDSLTLTVGDETVPLTVTQTNSDRIAFNGNYTFPGGGTYNPTVTATGHWEIEGSSLASESGSVSTRVTIEYDAATGSPIDLQEASTGEAGTAFYLETTFRLNGNTPENVVITGPGTTVIIPGDSLDRTGDTITVGREYTFPANTTSGNVQFTLNYRDPAGNDKSVSSEQLHIEIGGIDATNSANSLTFTNSGSANTFNYNGTIAGIHHGTGRFVIDSLTLTVGNDSIPLTVTQTTTDRITFNGNYTFPGGGTYNPTVTATGHWEIEGSSLASESASVSTNVTIEYDAATGSAIEIQSATYGEVGATFLLGTTFQLNGNTPVNAEITGPNGTVTASVDSSGTASGEYTFPANTTSGNVQFTLHYRDPAGNNKSVSSDQINIELGRIDATNNASSLTFTPTVSAVNGSSYNYSGMIAGIHHGTGNFVVDEVKLMISAATLNMPITLTPDFTENDTSVSFSGSCTFPEPDTYTVAATANGHWEIAGSSLDVVNSTGTVSTEVTVSFDLPAAGTISIEDAVLVDEGTRFTLSAPFEMNGATPVSVDIGGVGGTAQITGDALTVTDGLLSVSFDSTFPKGTSSGDITASMDYLNPAGELRTVTCEPLHIEIGGIDEVNEDSNLEFILSTTATDENTYDYNGIIAGIRHGTGAFVISNLYLDILRDGKTLSTMPLTNYVFEPNSDTVTFSGSHTFTEAGTYTITACAEGHWTLGTIQLENEIGTVSTTVEIEAGITGLTPVITDASRLDEPDENINYLTISFAYELNGKEFANGSIRMMQYGDEVASADAVVSEDGLTVYGTCPLEIFEDGTETVYSILDYIDEQGNEYSVEGPELVIIAGGLTDAVCTTAAISRNPTATNLFDYEITIEGINDGDGTFVIDNVSVELFDNSLMEKPIIFKAENFSQPTDGVFHYEGTWGSEAWGFPTEPAFDISVEVTGHWTYGDFNDLAISTKTFTM